MTIFVDASALVALLRPQDVNHGRAIGFWRRQLEEGGAPSLVTTREVAVEASAVLGSRTGHENVRLLHNVFLPPIEIHTITDEEWMRATSGLIAAASSKVSIVDRISFEFMRSLQIDHAFAFDRHFEDEGFTLVA